jgi:hypothetical protein
MAEPSDALDPSTVAVLAHGLLNNLGALSVAVEVLLRTHHDTELVDRLTIVVDGQLDTMIDALRLLVRGLPEDVVALLGLDPPPGA